MEMKRYKQIGEVPWLNTPGGTIWIAYDNDNWIQPEDGTLRETILGVDLDLLIDNDNEFLFELIKEKQ
jgi:hypothetical protein